MSFYLVPMTGTGTRQDPIVPKYVPALGVSWLVVQFGATGIVWADATPAMDASIAANADATVIPPLDSTVGNGALAAVQSEIETLGMPGGWVTATMTYRGILRVLVGMAQLIQRVSGILGSTPTIAGNLDKTLAQLPLAVRNAISQACTDLGIDTTNITGATTLRAALLDFGQQFIAGRTIALGDL